MRIDWQKLRETIHIAVRFLDNVIEVNRYPFSEIANASRASRKIGLGVMGFAEMLLQLGVPYSSQRAVQLAERVSRFLSREAEFASRELALERGSFPLWSSSLYRLSRSPMRNATRTAIAPTGTISIIAGTTSGIEPLFALAYRRVGVLEGETLAEVNPIFLRYAARHQIPVQDLKEWLLQCESSSELPWLPKRSRAMFATALEIHPEQHLQIQAAFQRHVDNSVSKTVNLPVESTVEDVARIYRRAWKLRLKGITIYRYGSRSNQVLQLGGEKVGDFFEHSASCDPDECRL